MRLLRVRQSPVFRRFICSLFFLLCWPLVASATKINGIDYVRLNTVASRLGMTSSWIQQGKKQKLASDWTKMVFTIHKRDFTLNGTVIYLGNPIAAKDGYLYLSQLDYNKTLRPILLPQSDSSVPGQLKHIVLDPGHGGKDPGAQNTHLKLREKDLTLDLAKRLKKELEKLGYRVSLTRGRDVFIELGTRPILANNAGADLFISLHFNAASNAKVSGAETYAFTPRNHPSTSGSKLYASCKKNYPGNRFDTWNELVAYYVQRQLVHDLKTQDRGVKRARFAVLKGLKCPGILIEGGFISNTREGKNVGWSKYRDNMAKAIAGGISVYDKTITRIRK